MPSKITPQLTCQRWKIFKILRNHWLLMSFFTPSAACKGLNNIYFFRPKKLTYYWVEAALHGHSSSRSRSSFACRNEWFCMVSKLAGLGHCAGANWPSARSTKSRIQGYFNVEDFSCKGFAFSRNSFASSACFISSQQPELAAEFSCFGIFIWKGLLVVFPTTPKPQMETSMSNDLEVITSRIPQIIAANPSSHSLSQLFAKLYQKANEHFIFQEKESANYELYFLLRFLSMSSVTLRKNEFLASCVARLSNPYLFKNIWKFSAIWLDLFKKNSRAPCIKLLSPQVSWQTYWESNSRA